MTITTWTTHEGLTAVRIQYWAGRGFALAFKTRQDAAALLKALRKRVRK